MGRLLPVLAIVLAASCARAAEGAPAEGPETVRPHGIITHGDSSGFMEDFYGDRVERDPTDAVTGAHKRDPAVNWDDRRVRR